MAVNLVTSNSPLAGIHAYETLVLAPLLEQSRVLQHVRVIQTQASIVHIPRGSAAVTGWYSEAQAITQSDGLVDEITCTPRKNAALALLSNELADDTSPGAVSSIGSILVASVANAVDSAFFTGDGIAPNPLGVGEVTDTSPVGTGLTLDGFADAIQAIEDNGGTATVAWMSPAEWAGFTKSLTDHPTVAPTGELQRSLLGVTVVPTTHCPVGTIYVADGQQVVAVVRTDGELAVSRDAAFTSDSTLVRVTSRIGYAYPRPETVAVLTSS